MSGATTKGRTSDSATCDATSSVLRPCLPAVIEMMIDCRVRIAMARRTGMMPISRVTSRLIHGRTDQCKKPSETI